MSQSIQIFIWSSVKQGWKISPFRYPLENIPLFDQVWFQIHTPAKKELKYGLLAWHIDLRDISFHLELPAMLDFHYF